MELSPCCGATVTFHDDTLCCKKCWKEVSESVLSEPPVILTREQYERDRHPQPLDVDLDEQGKVIRVRKG
jgi:hypothetical protein